MVFLAAYMSTVASQLNWGTSYLINDFYRRFIKKNADEKHYVLASRIGMAIVVVFSLVLTRYVLTTVSGAWEFILAASAGTGAVLILRWFWWRINAWSEIASMITPFIIFPIAKYGYGMEFPITLYPIVAGTTIVWLVVTFLTKPVDRFHLQAFYKKVHPGGIGWRPIARELPEVKSDSGFGRMFLNWLFGVVLVYSSLFGIGKLLFGEYISAFIYLSLAIVSIGVIYFNLRKSEFEVFNERMRE